MQVFDKRWMDSLKQEFMVNIFLISAVFYWKDIIQPSNTFVILLFNFFINFCRMSMFKRYIVNHSKIKQPSWKHKNISLSVCVYIVSKYHNVFFLSTIILKIIFTLFLVGRCHSSWWPLVLLSFYFHFCISSLTSPRYGMEHLLYSQVFVHLN